MNATQIIEQVRPSNEDKPLRFAAPCAEATLLGQWVFEAASGVEDSRLRPAGFACPVQPRALLALITYCYAAGIYASRDVESRLHRHDGITRLLCGPELLDRQTIRRFRRDNFSAVVCCLSRTLAAAFGQLERGNNGIPSWPENLQPTHRNHALRISSEETIVAEARRRVEWAVFLDSMALDE